MSLKFFRLLCIFALSTLSVFANSKQKSIPKAAKGAFFRENKGQVKDQNWQPRPDILFSGESNGLTYHLKKDGLHYQLSKVDSWKEETEERGLKHPCKEAHKVPDQMSLYRVDVTWLGANPYCEIITGDARPDYENFYNVPEGVEPALFVKSYASVTYKNLYENIDLKFYQTPNGELEYDFIVHPGGDYKRIQLDIQGATLSLNQKQELEITTPLGTITEGTLKVHQEGKIINAVWVLNNATTVSYQIENYTHTVDLTIDPPVRLWGTYYGGGVFEFAKSCSTDGLGNVFIAGNTTSTTSIATIGAHQTTLGPGPTASYDAYLVKLDSIGIRQWSTYYGGYGMEWGNSCTIDNQGNVYLAGRAPEPQINWYPNAISTSGSHQETFGGGLEDAFLVKFNTSGIRLWGTYYGGSSGEWAEACITDNQGNVYLTGMTGSDTAIATSGGHQPTNNGGPWEGFLVKFDSSGTRLWGTYYGGSEDDEGQSCSIDSSGNVYMAGLTFSSTSIATIGAHQTSLGSPDDYDAFLAKFDSSGTRLWGTYYGGSARELGVSCATDIVGNVYMAGNSSSNAGIATIGAHQTINGGGARDAFLVKFDNSGTRLWGTFYGGIDLDEGYSCTTDTTGEVYLAGVTFSTNSISTLSAHQTTFGGVCDAFLVKFNDSGSRIWGTYYGGTENEVGYSCSTDENGIIYLAGKTGSINDISTLSAHQPTYGGGSGDAFLVKFDGTGSTTGLEALQENTSPFTLSPNPGQNQLTISGLPEGTIFDLSILNTLGQVVYFSKELLQSENLDINLPNGLYEVIVETKNERYAQKWVVE